MATMNVPDFAGISTPVEKPNPNGRVAAANSRPTAWSTEDLAAITALGTKIDAVFGAVDGLEALNTALNALVTLTNGYVDGIESAIASTNSLLTTQNSYVDGLEAAVASTNTKLDTLNAALASTNPSAVYGAAQFIPITFTADTAVLAAGDIIADTQPIAGAVRANDAIGLLQSLTFIDPDDQKQPVKVVFFKANRSLGTENAQPTISDANAADVLGVVDILAADYSDLGGVSVATPNFKPFGLIPEGGTQIVYMALLNSTGTPTYAGGAPKVLLTVLS